MNYNALLCTSMKYSEFRTLNMNLLCQYVLVSFLFIPSDIFIQLPSCLEIFRAASKTNLSAVWSVSNTTQTGTNIIKDILSVSNQRYSVRE